MSKIKIGADELILWLRKNNHAAGVANDILGKRICQFIGERPKPENENFPVRWCIKDKLIVNELNLPATAAQYEITTDKLEELYEEMLTW